MTADKRTVATDALETLGTTFGEGQKRDAIHLAVVPMVAKFPLTPGQHVDKDGLFAPRGAGVGIVDPFLPGPVALGEHFWLVLYPRVITSLRHVWSHPDFEEEAGAPAARTADKAAAEAWLRDFCDGYDKPNYDLLLSALLSDDGESSAAGEDYYGVSIQDGYILTRGHDSHGDIPREFWDHAETLTGKKFASRPGHFSCSC